MRETVCVCVRESERKSECVCVCVREREVVRPLDARVSS